MGMMRTVVANRDLARLEIVWACVCLVRWALAILVGLYAYREAGVTGVGVSALVRMVPAAVLAPRLSQLADHRSRRRVLLASLVLRVGFAVGMAAVVAADGSLALLLAFAAAYGVADSMQRPTQAALLGVHAANPTELAAANTLWSMLDNAGFLVGSLVVGLVVGLAGIGEAIGICVLPLLVASTTAWRLSPDTPRPPLPDVGRAERALAGVVAVARDSQLRLLSAILVADMFVQAMVDVLLVVMALGLLDMGPEGAGWLSAAWGVGGVLGGAAAAVLLARRRLAWGLTVGLLLGGLPLATIAVWPEQAVALALMTALGVGFGIVEVALLTLTQRLVAADVMGRVYGVQETLTAVAMALGAVTASALVTLAGQSGALILTGAVLPLCAVVLLRGVRRLDAGGTAPEEVFEILRAVPAFASLPVATVENLAQRTRWEEYDAGCDVVRQGEPGETFYVIAHGAVRITEDDVVKRVERDAEFFGEIALLHQVPRTATAHTVEPTTLLALDQDEFLAAVGAHPRTSHELHDVASSRFSPAAPRPD